jgi:hypothetical protein
VAAAQPVRVDEGVHLALDAGAAHVFAAGPQGRRLNAPAPVGHPFVVPEARGPGTAQEALS